MSAPEKGHRCNCSQWTCSALHTGISLTLTPSDHVLAALQGQEDWAVVHQQCPFGSRYTVKEQPASWHPLYFHHHTTWSCSYRGSLSHLPICQELRTAGCPFVGPIRLKGGEGGYEKEHPVKNITLSFRKVRVKSHCSAQPGPTLGCQKHGCDLPSAKCCDRAGPGPGQPRCGLARPRC